MQSLGWIVTLQEWKGILFNRLLQDIGSDGKLDKNVHRDITKLIYNNSTKPQIVLEGKKMC